MATINGTSPRQALSWLNPLNCEKHSLIPTSYFFSFNQMHIYMKTFLSHNSQTSLVALLWDSDEILLQVPGHDAILAFPSLYIHCLFSKLKYNQEAWYILSQMSYLLFSCAFMEWEKSHIYPWAHSVYGVVGMSVLPVWSFLGLPWGLLEN